MYPDEKILAEIGRVTVAAGRVDAALGDLWFQLGPDRIEEGQARRASAAKQRDGIRSLAAARLDEAHRVNLLALIDEVQAAQRQRNAVMHSRWLLRGPDSTRPVSEGLSLEEGERAAYLKEWEREAVDSDGWLRQPNDDIAPVPPHRWDELRDLERRLSRLDEILGRWSFRIASMREINKPAGWIGPLVRRTAQGS